MKATIVDERGIADTIDIEYLPARDTTVACLRIGRTVHRIDELEIRGPDLVGPGGWTLTDITDAA